MTAVFRNSQAWWAGWYLVAPILSPWSFSTQLLHQPSTQSCSIFTPKSLNVCYGSATQRVVPESICYQSVTRWEPTLEHKGKHWSFPYWKNLATKIKTYIRWTKQCAYWQNWLPSWQKIFTWLQISNKHLWRLALLSSIVLRHKMVSPPGDLKDKNKLQTKATIPSVWVLTHTNIISRASRTVLEVWEGTTEMRYPGMTKSHM